MAEHDKASSVFAYMRSIVGGQVGMSDEELLALYLDRRDTNSFELLMWRYVGMVHKVCHKVLRDHHAAEDVSQAVFLILARNAGSIKKRDKLAGWLYRAAYRLSIRANSKRFRKSTVPLPENLPESKTPLNDAELSKDLLDAVSRLPAKFRNAVVLLYIEGLSNEEAAKRLELPVGTVAAHGYRGKVMLQKILTRREVAVPIAGVLAIVASGSSEVRGQFTPATLNAAIRFAQGQTDLPGVSALTLELAKAGVREAIRINAWWAAVVALSTISVAVAIVGLEQRDETSIPSEASFAVIAPLPARSNEIDQAKVSAWEKLGAIYGTISVCNRDELFIYNGLGEKPFTNLVQSRFEAAARKHNADSYPGFLISSTKHIEELPPIVSPFGIDLRGATPTDADIHQLVKNQNLKMIALSGGSFSDEAMKDIATLKSLEHLEISGGKITDEGIRRLDRLPVLTRLHLNCPLITDAGVEALSHIKELSSLSIVGAKIGDPSVTRIAGLTKLKRLFLVSSEITDVGFAALMDVDKLEFLAIHSFRVQGKGLERVEKLAGLTHLDMSSTDIPYDFLRPLKRLRSLKCLRMRNTHSADGTAAVLSEFPSLIEVDLTSSSLSDEGLVEFAKMEHLERLSVVSTGINGTGFESLARIKNLQDLQLACYSDEGMSLNGISSWRNLKQLRRVSLYCNRIGAESVKHFAELNNISHLEIKSRDSVAVRSADWTKPLTEMKNLTSLDLRLGLHPEAIKKLAAMTNLTHLSFICLDFQDDSIEALTALANLTELAIDSPKITNEGMNRLKKSLPHCTVSRFHANLRMTQKD